MDELCFAGEARTKVEVLKFIKIHDATVGKTEHQLFKDGSSRAVVITVYPHQNRLVGTKGT